jgi:hypothetical protein
MKYKKTACILLVIALAFPTLANKKARVVTESGKKWDVVFLRMSNDTIYLKARKPSGALFSISGHKSKFRKVEFTDGSSLDFSLSDFPSTESKNKLKESGSIASSRDTVFLTTANVQQYQKDSIFLANKAIGEQLPGGANAFSTQSTTQIKTDSTSELQWVSDSSEMKRSYEMTSEDFAGDSEAVISIETKPSNASVKIDNKTIEGTTPLTVKHVAAGEHIIVASKDLLQASKTVTLTNGEMKHELLVLEKSQSTQSAVGKKKGRRLAISLGVLSIASFAASAGTYYLYNRDHPSEVKTFESLNNSLVKGSTAESLIAKNQSQHDKAQMRLDISQILLGAGVAFFATGIVIYF